MQEKISIQTITEKDKPALQVMLHTVNGTGAILSLVAINGTMLRLVALPDGISVVSLEKISDASIHVKIETSHHTLLRKIEIGKGGQTISV